MAEFLERSLDCLKQLSLPPSFTEIEDDPILHAELNGAGCSVMDCLMSPTMGLMDYYLPFAINDYGGGEFSALPPVSTSAEPLPLPPPPPTPPPPVGRVAEQSDVDRKRKMIATPETSSQNCSAVYSATASAKFPSNRKNNGWKSGKRPKSTDSKQGEKPSEVVHVRARRGQAIDSHSLAERVRRRKINERMRCLQDLVPGCYKTMGMAGVLDEIINYVQSLQNQVEFLSMKLSAANSFDDFNFGVESMPTNQVAENYNKANETEMRTLLRGRGGCGCDHVASATSTQHRQHHHQQNRCTFDS